MNGWERNGKRMVKSAIWASALIIACWALNVDLTLNLLGVVLITGFFDHLMDAMWPTSGKDAA